MKLSNITFIHFFKSIKRNTWVTIYLCNFQTLFCLPNKWLKRLNSLLLRFSIFPILKYFFLILACIAKSNWFWWRCWLRRRRRIHGSWSLTYGWTGTSFDFTRWNEQNCLGSKISFLWNIFESSCCCGSIYFPSFLLSTLILSGIRNTPSY